jgi:hypothetical protein
MRWLALMVLFACGEDVDKPALEGPYACDTKSCSTGQICILETAGSQCQVNPDAGIDQYEVLSSACVDLPTACDGVPSCDCVQGPGMCFGASFDGRTVTFGCI